MKTLIICRSYHHNNTAKIASVFAKTLDAEIKTPSEVNLNSLSDYDLIGFGSGIYFGKHHISILDFVDNLPHLNHKKSFIFSTSGHVGDVVSKYHQNLREKLQSKGFKVIGEFNCAELDAYDIVNTDGNLNKGRPNDNDLNQAEIFARSLM